MLQALPLACWDFLFFPRMKQGYFFGITVFILFFQYCNTSSRPAQPAPVCQSPLQTAYTSFEYHMRSSSSLRSSSSSAAAAAAAVKESLWCRCPPGHAFARADLEVRRLSWALTLVVTRYNCVRVSRSDDAVV